MQVQFPRQHDLRKSNLVQKHGFFDSTNVGLRTGMQLDRRQVHFQQAHVLHNQRVGAGVIQLPYQFPCGFQLVVVQDGVERNENLRIVLMRVGRQPRDVGHRIFGTGTGAKRGPADVDRICPVIHGFDADVGIPGGGKQFEITCSWHGFRLKNQ